MTWIVFKQNQASLPLPTPEDNGTDFQQALSVMREEQVHSDLPMGAEGTLVSEADDALHPETDQDSGQLV